MIDILKGVFGLAAIAAGFVWLPAGIALVSVFGLVCVIDGLLAQRARRVARQSRASQNPAFPSEPANRRD